VESFRGFEAYNLVTAIILADSGQICLCSEQGHECKLFEGHVVHYKCQ
jgi:hypothetical protein